MGILLGILLMPGSLYAHAAQMPDEDPNGVENNISEVKVFPNPSDGRFQLTFDHNGEVKVSAKVYDITGKLIKDISDELVRSENSVSANVELENPGSGIYFIRIELGKTLLTKKIIIR